MSLGVRDVHLPGSLEFWVTWDLISLAGSSVYILLHPKDGKTTELSDRAVSGISVGRAWPGTLLLQIIHIEPLKGSFPFTIVEMNYAFHPTPCFLSLIHSLLRSLQ